MEVAVDGWRAGAADWEAVRSIPTEQLPKLTPEQQEVAAKLGIAPEDYARSVLAGRRSTEELLGKAERFGTLLQRTVQRINPQVAVERVALRTVEDRFDVVLATNGRRLPLHIPEALVDEYFERGSLEAEQSLTRIVERSLLLATQ